MGRPPLRSNRLVAVSIDGRGAAWCDGTYAGDGDLVAYARHAARVAMPVTYGNREYVAGDQDVLDALMSLIAYSPGRAIVAEAPAHIRSLLATSFEPDPTTIYDIVEE